MKEYPKYTEYARDVVDGNIVVGKWVKLACKRFLRFIDDDDKYYDEEAVERVIRFVQRLRHFKGSAANKPFILEPWQINFIAMVYGIKWKKDGLRVCREALLTVARKNGKSAFAAALLLYSMLEENGAEGYVIANNAKQAGLLYEVCVAFVESIDRKQKHFKRYRDTIKLPAKKSKIRCLASDSNNGNLDGLNPNFACIDEVHGLRDSAIPSVFRSAVMNREQPLILFTSTAGFNQYGFLYEFEGECREILQGLKKDDSLVALIYELDEEDDWKDEKNWIKANPNLGVSVRYEALKREVDNAIQTPSKTNDMLIKNMNMWVQTMNSWLPDHYVLEASKDIPIDFFKDKVVYCGVDLSAVSDLTALSIMLPPSEDDEKYYFKTIYYLPETCLQDGMNAPLYRKWYNEKYLKITRGNVVDYDAVTNDLINLSNQSMIDTIAFDSWNSTSWAQDCETLGLPLGEYSQSIGNFNRPTKEWERLILQGKLVIDNNPITRWMIQNVNLKFDYNNNCKPVKKTGNDNNNKIDGVIAMLECLGTYLLQPKYNNQIYSI